MNLCYHTLAIMGRGRNFVVMTAASAFDSVLENQIVAETRQLVIRPVMQLVMLVIRLVMQVVIMLVMQLVIKLVMQLVMLVMQLVMLRMFTEMNL